MPQALNSKNPVLLSVPLRLHRRMTVTNEHLMLEAFVLTFYSEHLLPRMKISVSADISVIGFYGYIGYISVDIFT